MEANCEYTEQRLFDYMLFVQTWQGSFCADGCCTVPQRGVVPPTGFSIHGLWPEYRDGTYPSCCRGNVTRALIDALQATEDDCDDIAGLPGRADGVVVSVTIRELTDGRSKISVRTTPEVDSCAICAVYGGGGHKMASGCTLACDPETAVEKILAAIDQVWPA